MVREVGEKRRGGGCVCGRGRGRRRGLVEREEEVCVCGCVCVYVRSRVRSCGIAVQQLTVCPFGAMGVTVRGCPDRQQRLSV